MMGFAQATLPSAHVGTKFQERHLAIGQVFAAPCAVFYTH